MVGGKEPVDKVTDRQTDTLISILPPPVSFNHFFITHDTPTAVVVAVPYPTTQAGRQKVVLSSI